MTSKQLLIDESTLLRYFAKELTAEERDAIQQWISFSDENARKARKVYKLYYTAEMLQVQKQVSVDKALHKVKKQIHSKSLSFIHYFQRIAAILILPLFILFAYMFVNDWNKEGTVEYVEMRTNPGMLGSVILPDGSKVWLNSDSYIKYPVHFTGNMREVSMEGEAYFSVTHHKDKRFIVHTPQENVRIEVLGTEFNVDAYRKAGFITTTLIQGSVHLNYKDAQNKEEILSLKPLQQVVYNKETQTANFYPTYVKKDIAWKDGHIVLRNTSLQEILWILSKRFDVDFEVKNPVLMKYAFTGTFTDEHLERILKHFELASDIRYHIEQKVNQEGKVQKRKVFLYK